MRRQVRVLAVAAALLGLVGGAVLAGPVPAAMAAAPSYCAAAASPRPSGGFLSPTTGFSVLPTDSAAGGYWTAADWKAPTPPPPQSLFWGSFGVFDTMQNLCMDTLVLQSTAQTWAGDSAPSSAVPDSQWPRETPLGCVSPDTAGPTAGLFVVPFYHSGTAFGSSTWNANANACKGTSAGVVDQVGLALAAAQATNTKVWLGLQSDEKPWFGTGPDDQKWMQAQADLSIRIVKDLWAQYGPAAGAGVDYSSTIAGFYLPFEANMTFTGSSASGRQANYASYLTQVSTAIQQLGQKPAAGLGSMIAPYFSSPVGQDAASLAAAQSSWTSAMTGWLAGTGVTVVSVQDGMGADRMAGVLGGWAQASRQAIANAGSTAQLWDDAEAFATNQSNHADRSGWGSTVTNVTTSALVKNMQGFATASGGADKYVVFSLRDFDPNLSHFDPSVKARVNLLYYFGLISYLSTGTVPVQSFDALQPVNAGNPGSLTAVLTGSTVSGLSATDVTLNWKVIPTTAVHAPAGSTGAVIPVVGYQLWRDGIPAGQIPQKFSSSDYETSGFPKPDVSGTGVMSYTDVNLQPGHTYNYQVSGFDALGNMSPLSSSVPVSIARGPGLTMAGGFAADLAVNAPYQVTTAGPDLAVNPGGGFGNEVAPSPNYKDTTPVQDLIDGVTGQAAYGDPAWVGQMTAAQVNNTYTVTVDLGTNRPVNTVRSHWLSQPVMGVVLPASVSVSYLSNTGNSDPGTTTFTALAGSGATPNPGLPSTSSTDPATVWVTTSPGAGTTVTARFIRLTVAAPPTANTFTFLSEVQVLDASGTTNYAASSTAGSGTSVPKVYTGAVGSGWNSTNGNYPISRPGLLTSRPNVSPAANGTYSYVTGFEGWCMPATTVSNVCPAASSAVASAVASNSFVFKITVDLGSNQQIGSLSSSWLYDASAGIQVPSSVGFAYRKDAAGADWVSVGSKYAPNSATNGYQIDYTQTVPKVNGVPASARWVTYTINTNNAAGWFVFASAVHVYAPDATVLTQGGAPSVFRVGSFSTINHSVAPPFVPVPSSPVALTCGASGPSLPSNAYCQYTDTGSGASSKLGVLTGLTSGTTPTALVGNTADLFSDGSHWVGLGRTTGIDIIIPVTSGSGSSMVEVGSNFVQRSGSGIVLPASVDYYYTTGSNPMSNPGTVTWTQYGPTVLKPNLPPDIPSTTVMTWNYTARLVASDGTPSTPPAGVTAIRVHVENPSALWAFTDHVGAYAW